MDISDKTLNLVRRRLYLCDIQCCHLETILDTLERGLSNQTTAALARDATYTETTISLLGAFTQIFKTDFQIDDLLDSVQEFHPISDLLLTNYRRERHQVQLWLDSAEQDVSAINRRDNESGLPDQVLRLIETMTVCRQHLDNFRRIISPALYLVYTHKIQRICHRQTVPPAATGNTHAHSLTYTRTSALDCQHEQEHSALRPLSSVLH